MINFVKFLSRELMTEYLNSHKFLCFFKVKTFQPKQTVFTTRETEANTETCELKMKDVQQ